MNLQPHERIIVALDVSDTELATQLVGHLYSHVGMFKVGFEFLYASLASLLTITDFDDASKYLYRLRTLFSTIGGKLFDDVKFNDIPNTVGKAAKAIAGMNPAWFNVHASAGQKAIAAAVANKGTSKLFGVTVLTSIDDQECNSIFGDSPNMKVLKFADMLLKSGADGIICAPKEGLLLRRYPQFGKMTIACPNVRPSWALTPDDQNKDRQMTPFDAIASGIDMLVLGRPITNPPAKVGGPVQAAIRIAEEIEKGLAAE